MSSWRRDIFQKDKIASVFESQNLRLESAKSVIDSEFEKAVVFAKAAVATFDFTTGKLSQDGERIFRGEPTILALELWNEQSNRIVFRFEKKRSVLPFSEQRLRTGLGETSIENLSEGKILVSTRYVSGDQGPFRLRFAIDLSDLVPSSNPTRAYALVHGHEPIFASDLMGLDGSVLSVAAKQTSAPEDEDNWILTKDREQYLVSSASLNFGDLRLVAVTPEKAVISTFQTLFHRSLFFLIASGLGLMVFGLILSRNISSKLVDLASSARHIGRENFQTPDSLNTKDELGLVASALNAASSEIHNLLIEDERQKTKKLVQEVILPKNSRQKFGDLEIHAAVRDSGEYGGDWWHVFPRGDEVIVALSDLGIRGTQGALIQAVSRSLFARIEKENVSIQQMMSAWQRAMAKCCNHQGYGSGLILQVNLKTFEGSFVSFAHEPPYLLRELADYSFSIELPLERSFLLTPNDSMILYTDGLFAPGLTGRPQLTEDVFKREIVAQAEFARSAEKITRASIVLAASEDVSVVVIRRKGPDRSAFLENDLGDLNYGVSV